jgi:hypothetical protein
MIGRITNGGFMITSRPLIVAAAGLGLAVSVGPAVAEGVGDSDGDGDSDGEGDGEGVGVAASSVKLAQGNGATLAHRWWTPGASPENGLTLVVKLPLASAFAPPATLLFGGSQYRVICSLARKAPPFTVICVLGPPAVTSSDRNAFTGVGVGSGLGEGVGDGVGDGEPWGVGEGEGEGEADGVVVGEGAGGPVAATSRNHSGRVTRIRNLFIGWPVSAAHAPQGNA